MVRLRKAGPGRHDGRVRGRQGRADGVGQGEGVRHGGWGRGRMGMTAVFEGVRSVLPRQRSARCRRWRVMGSVSASLFLDEYTEDVEDMEDTENTENMVDVKDMEDVENMEDGGRGGRGGQGGQGGH